MTQQRFGKVIRLFAPLYLSNECINNCKYCGFSRDNPILRLTLSPEEVRQEAQALAGEGFRNILLVAGEHPKFVSTSYLRQCVAAVHEEVPSVSLEVGPLETRDYRPLTVAGADGLVVYQETYDRKVYAEVHTSGPKRDFDWRLETPERAYAAGFRRLGISALYGLGDWRYEAMAVAAHAEYLQRYCWRACLTISLARLRPCAGEFQPLTHMGDRDLVQLLCAFRLLFPDAGLVLSTRESPRMRNGLIRLGVTLMSAGSHTEPGGYTGAGRDRPAPNRSRADRAGHDRRRSTGTSRAAGQCHRAIRHRRRPLAAGSGRGDSGAGIRTGVERLGGGTHLGRGRGPPGEPEGGGLLVIDAVGQSSVIANGQKIEQDLPCSIQEFLVGQKLPPRSVVVEQNGEAVAPSEFSNRMVRANDRLEIVKIVAGG